MDFKEKLKQIKNILFSDETQEQEITFMDIRTVDGRIMRVNELIEGESIQEVTEDGLIDVEAGEYQIDGDLVVIVGEGSVISEIRAIVDEIVETDEVEEEFSAETETETEDETTAETEVEVEVVEQEVNFNSEIIEILERLTNDFNEYKENVTKELEVIKEDFSKFKKQPSVEPTDVKKIDFSKEMDKFEKLKYFSKR